jgi:hypothetical protein
MTDCCYFYGRRAYNGNASSIYGLLGKMAVPESYIWSFDDSIVGKEGKTVKGSRPSILAMVQRESLIYCGVLHWDSNGSSN